VDEIWRDAPRVRGDFEIRGGRNGINRLDGLRPALRLKGSPRATGSIRDEQRVKEPGSIIRPARL
jgi:hypothetical protein